MERHSMRNVREVLRLRFERKLTQREIATATGLSKGSVCDYLRRARVEGVTWESAHDLSDQEVESKLFVEQSGVNSHTARATIDFNWIQTELRKPGVTLQQLWLEYREGARARGLDSAYQYSQFCVQYAGFKRKLDVSMRQVHRAGEKLFIDYSGKKPCVYDPQTGEQNDVELFVAVLGASNYTYAEATRTQQLADFVGSTIRAFEFLGGVPQIIVPDQLKSAVKRPDRYAPGLNPTFLELAQHYEVAVIPARPRKPKDKAKVEVGVQIAQRWILACLRNRRFFSLEELNEAIGELLERLNARLFQKLEGSRRSAFETIDQPALRALPLRRYELGVWKKATVNIDYHIDYEGRHYSVPHQLARQPVELRVTGSTVEVFQHGKRVATHRRSYGPKGTPVTLDEHRPKSHRDYGAWPPSRLIAWASSIGPSVAQVTEAILSRQPHPEMGYRSCLALLRESKRYPSARVEAACRRALTIGAPTRKSVSLILRRGLDGVEFEPDEPELLQPVVHDNVRGGAYFDRKEAHD